MTGDATASQRRRETSEGTVEVGDFKQAGRRFASGVTVVTTRAGEVIHGATVSAFTTLSLEPLQVMISLGQTGRMAALIREGGIFAVSILAAEQEGVSRAFATPSRPTCMHEFPDVRTSGGTTGAPIVEGCLAFFDCRVADAVDTGDHTIFIGKVQSVGAIDGAPLIYFDGAYRRLNLDRP